MIVPVHWNSKNKFAVARVHFSVDPQKNNPTWIERAKQGVPPRSWEREYEISYEVFDGKPVFETFHENLIQSFDWQLEKQQYVYRGWDFGYHHPAVTFAFFNEYDQFCIRHSIMGENETIKDFGNRVRNFSLANYPNAKWLDACDYAGNQVSDKAEFTSVEVLNGMGIYPSYKQSRIVQGLEILRQRMMMRNDGKYGFMIHPDCQILIDAFKGGYRYAVVKEGQEQKEEPFKDGYYDHGIDSTRYICVNYMEVAPDRSMGLSDEEGWENDIMSDRNTDSDLFVF